MRKSPALYLCAAVSAVAFTATAAQTKHAAAPAPAQQPQHAAGGQSNNYAITEGWWGKGSGKPPKITKSNARTTNPNTPAGPHAAAAPHDPASNQPSDHAIGEKGPIKQRTDIPTSNARTASPSTAPYKDGEAQEVRTRSQKKWLPSNFKVGAASSMQKSEPGKGGSAPQPKR